MFLQHLDDIQWHTTIGDGLRLLNPGRVKSNVVPILAFSHSAFVYVYKLLVLKSED